MKKTIAILLASIMIIGLVSGCQSSVKPTEKKAEEKTEAKTEAKAEEKTEAKAEETTAAPAEEEIYIPVISKGFQHQFWQAVKMGAEQAAEEFGVKITFEGPESETMVDKQIEMLQVALGKNPQAICLAALDSKAEVPYVQEADGKGIPVIGFDSGVDSDLIKATAATDNRAAAALAADKMAELIGGEGKVGVVVHDQTSQTGVDRQDGFIDKIKADYPDIEIVDVQVGEGDHLKSTEIVKTMLAAYPDLKGVFATNEGGAVGAGNAMREADKVGELVVVGFDSGKTQMQDIRDGVIAGAITQNPVGIGYEAVKAAYMAYKGEELEKVIDTGFYWYDKDNIDDPTIQAVLYE